MILSSIVAMAENRAIGRGGAIPWRIPGEQRRFRRLTMGMTVIMGRRSYEEIGRPLQGRRMIILTKGYLPEVETASSLYEALKMSKGKIFIAGGEEVYRTSMPYISWIYLTIVHRQVEGDTFFPYFDKKSFKKIYEERVMGSTPYTYLTYYRERPEKKLNV